MRTQRSLSQHIIFRRNEKLHILSQSTCRRNPRNYENPQVTVIYCDADKITSLLYLHLPRGANGAVTLNRLLLH